MTKGLTAYIREIRRDLQNKIQMLAPSLGMIPLEARRAQNLAEECGRLDAAIGQFPTQEIQPGQRRRVA